MNDQEIHVHTSPDRVFPLDAVCAAMRCAVQGKRVMLVQLLRGGIAQGPTAPRRLLERLVWLRPEINRIIDSAPDEIERGAVQALWHCLSEQLGEFDQLVLDEAGLAVQLGVITQEQLLELLRNRPSTLGIVLTGPGIPQVVAEWSETWTVTRARARLSDSGHLALSTTGR